MERRDFAKGVMAALFGGAVAKPGTAMVPAKLPEVGKPIPSMDGAWQLGETRRIRIGQVEADVRLDGYGITVPTSYEQFDMGGNRQYVRPFGRPDDCEMDIKLRIVGLVTHCGVV